MVFFEVLLALALERLWMSVATLRRFTWFMRFAAWGETRVVHANASSLPPIPAATMRWCILRTKARVHVCCC